MMKRMTLLAKKEGLSNSDFRAYWAGPHARLVLGMKGISAYTQNRVDKRLWSLEGEPGFDVDGIVELHFGDEEAMRAAQASSVGRRHIPADEPHFLRGWTLCLVEGAGSVDSQFGPSGLCAKVIVPLRLPCASREPLAESLARYALGAGLSCSVHWTSSTARRELLWSEPSPPDGFIVLNFAHVAAAHDAFEPGPLCTLLAKYCTAAAAYLVDALVIR